MLGLCPALEVKSLEVKSLEVKIMKLNYSFIILFGLLLPSLIYGQNQERIIFTAYQNFDSRLYVMEMDGTVLDYFEYANYRLQDFVVIDNEVYVTDAFIPCVYKVDISNGELDLVMHDTWLFYFYGLAWDGTYFYVDEWDMNRYDIEGNKDGMAFFDEDVMGSEFANGYYWMINDDNLIKCWDFSAWPDLAEMPDLHFAPPSFQCRGLWFDGEYFWSAESIEGNTGQIYRFGFDGQVVEQWTAPAFQGWGACKVEVAVGIHNPEKTNFALSCSPNPARSEITIAFTRLILFLECYYFERVYIFAKKNRYGTK